MSIDPHTPVTNQPEPPRAQADSAILLSDPSEGAKDVAAGKLLGGVEDVPGFQRLEFGKVARDAWTAPTAALPDIGTASFGQPPPPSEAVLGPDDRVRITDTTSYPWRAHASLLITAADGTSYFGTGWFIGPHTLATAGHVVYIKNSGIEGRDGWVRSIRVMPGRDGESLPYGFATSTNFRSTTAWTAAGDQNYDYGAIILPADLGAATGWFGFAVFPDADLVASTSEISGYPADKPTGTQWYDSRVISSVSSTKVYYDIDTMGGQSGSAVYRAFNGNRYGFAVHAYGGTTVNSGTRITRPVYDNLAAWSA
ncbi:trypsin-like serine peptidase [Streptomyces bobili]|uniref:trypsin-like serine peptidase n=1 Tax=Streptomyces bobili TaxID=67280 RepID=UPI003796D694